MKILKTWKLEKMEEFWFKSFPALAWQNSEDLKIWRNFDLKETGLGLKPRRFEDSSQKKSEFELKA